MSEEKYFKTLKDLPKEELFVQGHRACSGCGEAIAVRHIMKAIGPNCIVISPTGCLEVVSSPYPYTSWAVPWYHVAFENAASVASGVEAALKVLMRKGVLEKKKIHVVAIAGDGGTVDIGFQALSGALERGHGFAYICLDNEAYMNTGIQRSGATPYGAWTTTSAVGKAIRGKVQWKKNMPAIVASHGIPYVATACPAYPVDLVNKVKRAVEIEGPAYVHVLTPCVPGWRIPSNISIKVARLAVQTGIFPLYEIKDGKLTLTVKVPKRKHVKEYLKLQGRFAHLTDEEIEKIQERVDRESESLGLGPRA
ncbi:MAG: pyruvate synthase subunit beta [Candidatus Hecatellales archaeon]|nr:MAG: pyruvate synthase subunit beta [Candidatus Hecatellales archaeon]